MSFEGFPAAGLDFYDDLEVDNTRSYWEAHKEVYEASVRQPMVALCAALEMEFGAAKIFRPYRDVRFSKDKTPFKTHQGAFVRVAESTGWYVEVSPRGVRTGGGFYHAPADRLAAFRNAILDDRTGSQLEALLVKLGRKKRYEIGGEQLKTKPRGYDAAHPRVDLLRHKSLIVSHPIGFEPVIHTAEVLDIIKRDWRAIRPLVDWVAEHSEPRADR